MSPTATVELSYLAACRPCRWSESCDDYDEATLVAEEHDADHHAEATA